MYKRLEHTPEIDAQIDIIIFMELEKHNCLISLS